MIAYSGMALFFPLWLPEGQYQGHDAARIY